MISAQKKAYDSSPSRKWIDLSFLNLNIRTPKPGMKFGLYKARFSLLICGTGDRRWIGYAFVDRDFDCEEMKEEDFCYDGVLEDPITSHGGEVIDANMPIQDPRAYYLMIFENEAANVLQEWTPIVRALERDIDQVG